MQDRGPQERSGGGATVERMEPGEAFRRDVSRETRARLEIYEALLRRWQRRTNLVSTASLPSLWTRHFLDSAQLAPLLTADATRHTVDVGSGAGFPGMVLAILDGERRVTLVEANGKRCAFLREVADATGTAVSIVEGRLEDWAVRNRLAPCGTIAARACAPLVDLLGLVFPVLESHTYCIFPKGRRYRSELEAARLRWDFRADIVPSRTAAEARILRISDVERRRHP